MAGTNDNSLEYKIIKDFGAFGDGKWQKELSLIQWGNNEPKLDIRPWNEDMTKMGKGVTLDDAEAFDLLGLLEDALEYDSEED